MIHFIHGEQYLKIWHLYLFFFHSNCFLVLICFVNFIWIQFQFIDGFFYCKYLSGKMKLIPPNASLERSSIMKYVIVTEVNCKRTDELCRLPHMEKKFSFSCSYKFFCKELDLSSFIFLLYVHVCIQLFVCLHRSIFTSK